MRWPVSRLFRWLATVAICTGLLSAPASSGLDRVAAERQGARPNIVIIMSDDMGWSDHWFLHKSASSVLAT